MNGEEPIGCQFLQTIKNKGSRKKIRTLVSVRVLMSIFQWLYNFLVTAIPFSWFSLITFFLLISFAPSVKLLCTACYINYPFNFRWKICYKIIIIGNICLKFNCIIFWFKARWLRRQILFHFVPANRKALSQHCSNVGRLAASTLSVCWKEKICRR